MKIGLVLSGGGARGIAHIGAIKAFEEKNVKFSHVSGVSAGSIVGAFYCKGYSPDEILEIVESTSFYKILRPALSWRGLLHIDKAIEVFRSYIPEDTFEDLEIPLFVTATNINKGLSEYFESGDLLKIVQASCSIPVIFDPVQIGEQYYIDGGILNNLPIEPLVPKVDKIIGVHTNAITPVDDIGNMKNLIERSLQITINFNSYSRKGKCDLFVDPYELNQFAAFDFKRAKEIYNIGYEATSYAIDRMPNFEEIFGLNDTASQ